MAALPTKGRQEAFCLGRRARGETLVSLAVTGCDETMNRYNVATVAALPKRNGRRPWLPTRRTPRVPALKGLSMDKWLCWFSLGVAGVVFLFFLLDMLLHGAFREISIAVDIISLICCVLLAYLAWNAMRDIR
jgi:hypothetical protein